MYSIGILSGFNEFNLSFGNIFGATTVSLIIGLVIGFFWEWFQSVKHNSFFDMNDVVRTGLGALVGGCASLFFESQIIMIILLTVSATLVIKDLKK
jgi:Na+/H+-translocating membrane pyrophosphatase